MNKSILNYAIPAALAILCALGIFFAAKAPGETAPATPAETSVPTETTVPAETTAATEPAQLPPLPYSLLYYGRVEEMVADDNGCTKSIRLSSERYGEYVMYISQETAWVDSGERIAFDPAALTVGEQVYVFHSAIATMSLPPQSAAFAVVCNIPQDVRAACFLTVDSLETQDGIVTVTANNGTETFTVDEATTFSPYRTRNIVRLEDLAEGSRVMVWYDAAPQGNRASHVMLLPGTAAS